MRTSMQFGFRPPDSWVDVNGHVEVIPVAAANLPYAQRHLSPGYASQTIPFPNSPVNVSVKAGTSGVIELTMYASYSHMEVKIAKPIDIGGAPGVLMPVECKGRVSGRGVWAYDCSDAGALRFHSYTPEDSGPSDHFNVLAGKTNFAIPSGKYPQVRLATELRYDGFDTGREKVPSFVPWVGGDEVPGTGKSAPAVSVKNPDLFAVITVTGAISPTPAPSPPVPVPNFPLSHVAVIPFAKEGQRGMDEVARGIASEWVRNVFARFPDLKQPIMNGDTPVYFTGYASKTGPRGEKSEVAVDDYNIEIGYDRAKSVVEYLRPQLGNNAKLNYVSVGRQQAQWAKVFEKALNKTVEKVGKPREIDRCVVIWLQFTI